MWAFSNTPALTGHVAKSRHRQPAASLEWNIFRPPAIGESKNGPERRQGGVSFLAFSWDSAS
jgi:hypothetical protein